MKLGYADPPYPGCAVLFKDHPDYAGEVDHVQLIKKLEKEFEGVGRPLRKYFEQAYNEACRCRLMANQGVTMQ